MLSSTSDHSDSLPSTSVETSNTQYVDPVVENPVDLSPEMDQPTSVAQTELKTSLNTYSIEFEVANCAKGEANGAQFLSEFVRALTTMEKDSSVLVSNSKSDDNKINGTTQFPQDPTNLPTFVRKYIGGLRLTNKRSLKGKITVRTRCKFPALTKNKDVKTFLKGAWSGSKPTPVSFISHTLECSAASQVSDLTLDYIPRSPSSESRMPL
jgi:hypothetical protein